ncbi:hypothetical protein ACLMJK_000389 [Lecanora helva]
MFFSSALLAVVFVLLQISQCHLQARATPASSFANTTITNATIIAALTPTYATIIPVPTPTDQEYERSGCKLLKPDYDQINSFAEVFKPDSVIKANKPNAAALIGSVLANYKQFASDIAQIQQRLRDNNEPSCPEAPVYQPYNSACNLIKAQDGVQKVLPALDSLAKLNSDRGRFLPYQNWNERTDAYRVLIDVERSRQSIRDALGDFSRTKLCDPAF